MIENPTEKKFDRLIRDYPEKEICFSNWKGWLIWFRDRELDTHVCETESKSVTCDGWFLGLLLDTDFFHILET